MKTCQGLFAECNPFISVCDQTGLTDWLAEESGGVRAGDCSPPPLHPSPPMRLETVSGHGKWDTEPLGARLGCVCVVWRIPPVY